jgi:hypothetical protein
MKHKETSLREVFLCLKIVGAVIVGTAIVGVVLFVIAVPGHVYIQFALGICFAP